MSPSGIDLSLLGGHVLCRAVVIDIESSVSCQHSSPPSSMPAGLSVRHPDVADLVVPAACAYQAARLVAGRPYRRSQALGPSASGPPAIVREPRWLRLRLDTPPVVSVSRSTPLVRWLLLHPGRQFTADAASQLPCIDPVGHRPPPVPTSAGTAPGDELPPPRAGRRPPRGRRRLSERPHCAGPDACRLLHLDRPFRGGRRHAAPLTT